MRLSAGLTVVGALLLMAGVLMTVTGEAMRLKSPSGWQALISAGEVMAVVGLACGLAVMAAVAVGGSGRRPAGLRGARWGRARQWSQVSHRGGRRERAVKPESVGQRERAGLRERAGQRERAARRSKQDVAAEEWLSQFRSARPEYAPGPGPQPGLQPEQQYVPDRGLSVGYSDDGWHPEEVRADCPAWWPEPAFSQDAAQEAAEDAAQEASEDAAQGVAQEAVRQPERSSIRSRICT